jgi:hypothetical protein
MTIPLAKGLHRNKSIFEILGSYSNTIIRAKTP